MNYNDVVEFYTNVTSIVTLILILEPSGALTNYSVKKLRMNKKWPLFFIKNASLKEKKNTFQI